MSIFNIFRRKKAQGSPNEEESRKKEVIICVNCNKDFIWDEAYIQQQTPGSEEYNPSGHGIFRPRVFCPDCGFLVAEWDIDQHEDRGIWRWFGENAKLNKGRLLPPWPLGQWGRTVLPGALVPIQEISLNFEKLNSTLRELEQRELELSEIKKASWQDLWVTPTLVNVHIPAKFEEEFRREVALLPSSQRTKIVEAFQKHIESSGIPLEKERWIKGSADNVMRYIGGKIAVASEKSNFKSWQVERDPIPFLVSVCPLISINILSTDMRFSNSLVAKADEGELCVLDGFHPSFF